MTKYKKFLLTEHKKFLLIKYKKFLLIKYTKFLLTEYKKFFYFWATTQFQVMASLDRASRSHTLHTTLGWTSLDNWLARCTDLYLTKHITQNRQMTVSQQYSNPQSQQATDCSPIAQELTICLKGTNNMPGCKWPCEIRTVSVRRIQQTQHKHNIRKCCCARFNSSMMSHFITACITPDVSKDHSAFIFWVKQLKNEGSMMIHNAKNSTFTNI